MLPAAFLATIIIAVMLGWALHVGYLRWCRWRASIVLDDAVRRRFAGANNADRRVWPEITVARRAQSEKQGPRRRVG